jgi:EAL domain-containing protein (putative c-di-GMP-specific phosphodiesterase class I)
LKLITWFLEGFLSTDQVTRRLPIDRFPFPVGRGEDNALIVRSGEVSRYHAQFTSKENQLVLEDLRSTNGTFVNCRRITRMTVLRHGDIVRFGAVEYRIIGKAGLKKAPGHQDPEATFLSVTPFDRSVVPEGLVRLRELLDRHMVTAALQPIVLSTGRIVAHELLGRGTHPSLPVTPVELLKLAEAADLELELSETLRDRGVRLALKHGYRGPFFVNTHPAELLDPDRLFQSVSALRTRFPSMGLTLEIHEQAVTDINAMKDLIHKLRALDIAIAFDDFGAGQSRLLELVEVTPEIVKFDICLIRDIHRAPEPRAHMLRLLLRMCHDMGIKVLAEGVAREEEAAACLKLKFDYLQGFYFGAPMPIDGLL